MPLKVRKVRGQDCYQVKNMKTGVVHAKCSTKANAESQKRLLDGLDHGLKLRKK